MDNKNRLYVKVGKAVKDLLAGKQVMLQKDDECTDAIIQGCIGVFKKKYECQLHGKFDISADHKRRAQAPDVDTGGEAWRKTMGWINPCRCM